ncbi:MAG: flagellar basal body P-ring protein FlgI [Pirellulaceae bacterium]|nr:flagellar basal body P-ring protein FlgI [Pirellulaceae bacterium]
MKSRSPFTKKPSFARTYGPVYTTLFIVCLLVSMTSCSLVTWPETLGGSKKEDVLAKIENGPQKQYIGDFARFTGIDPLPIEGVGLVTNLEGKGGVPQKSPEQDLLLREMRIRGIDNPHEILASPDTAIVLVRGYLPAGVQKGDRFDIEVIPAKHNQSTNLQGGQMLTVRLAQLTKLRAQFKKGHHLGSAVGEVLTSATFDNQQRNSSPNSNLANTEQPNSSGFILGGGVSMTTRSIGLTLHKENRSALLASALAKAINNRFSIYDRNVKKGAATAKNDSFLEFRVPEQYKYNIDRYLSVISNIYVQESQNQQLARISELEEELLSATTASGQAALRLEAIGYAATESLKNGLFSPNEDVQFYSAEALAYLQQKEAIPVLVELTSRRPDLRWHALAALSSLDSPLTAEALGQLLHSEDPQVCYGALNTIVTRHPNHPLAAGQDYRYFRFHRLVTNRSPMVHFSRYQTPEVALFGPNVPLRGQIILDVGQTLMITSQPNNLVKVTRFGLGDAENNTLFCQANLEELYKVLAGEGINVRYGELLELTQQLQAKGHLAATIEIDALPLPDQLQTDLQVAPTAALDSNESTDPDSQEASAWPTFESTVSNPLKSLWGGK